MQKVKLKKKTYTKPRYNILQNSAYMINLAWKEKEKKVLLLSLLSALMSVANNLLNLYITPSVLYVVEEKAPVSQLISIILFFIGLMIFCSASAAYINTNIIYGRIQVRESIITALNKKNSTTSYPNTGDEKFKKLCGKAKEATCSNGEATEAIWGTLTNLSENIVGFAIYIALLASLDPLMVTVIIATALTGYIINKRLNEYEYRHREEVSEYENKMWYIDSKAGDYSAAKDIRLFAVKPWLEELGIKALESYLAFHKKANGVYLWSRITDLLLTFARNGIAYVYVVSLVLKNNLSASEFLLYFSAVGGFSSWISGILGNLSVLHRQSLDISTVRECLEYSEVFNFENGLPLNPDNNENYEIKLVNVSFRYPDSEKYILKKINLTLRSGEKLAVVGLNGAGKTTLVRLICGFYDPTEGHVLLNGKDIREYNRYDYYKMFSAVFQNFSLLADTIAVNISQTEGNIDFEKVKSCAARAGLLGKIESLPDGFETYLNRNVYENAVVLSGGETQRLMLARALYKDSPIIILDEPTAALDPIAEAELYKKYNEMTTGKASVYISHRLASTRFCDQIIFIENGCIAEEGTHNELLSAGGKYSALFEVQSRYYREENAANE